MTDVNVVIDPTNMRVLKVTNENETFYTTTIVVDDFPLDMEFTHIYEKHKICPSLWNVM